MAVMGWEWEFTLVTPVLLAAGAVMAGIGLYAWRNRDRTGAGMFAVLMATASLWALAYGLQLAAATEATARFWANVVHIAVASVPVAWLVFALRVTGRERWINRRFVAGLLVVPLIYVVLVWSNPLHNLVRIPHGLEATEYGFHTYRQTFGPAFWAHTAYAYSLMVAGTLLLAHLFTWSPSVHRRQVSLLIVGALVPAGTNAIHHSGFTPIENFDPTPFAFLVSGLFFLVAIFYYRLLDLRPVARSLVVDTLREGVIVLDPDDRIVDLNGAAGELLGIERETAIGSSFATVLEEESNARGDGGEIVAPGGSDGPTAAEVVLERPAGPRHLHCSWTPIVDLRGDSVGRSIVLRDVTRRRELQAEVDETLAQLQRSNEELESFARVISHDLRGPLRTAERYLQLLEEEPTDEEMRAVASQSVERAQAMVDDLLEYSTIGQDGSKFEPVDCGSVMENVLETLRFEIEDQRGTVTVDELPTVQGVDHLIERLLLNLVSNALTYSGEDPATVRVDATRAGDRWHLRVADEGIGIPAGERDQVLDLFGQAAGTDHGGTGVGLSICQKIAEIHDGDLTIDSTPGEGTTVTVDLPGV